MSKEILHIVLLSDGSELEVIQEDLKYVIDAGTYRDCFICDRMYQSTESAATLTTRFSLAELTLTNGETIFTNPQALGRIKEQSSNEVWIRFDCLETIVVSGDITTVKNTLNAALPPSGGGGDPVRETFFFDGEVANTTDEVILDGVDIVLTIPADRTRNLLVVNESAGNATIDPITNTIGLQDTGTISGGSAWNLLLFNTNWRIV